MRYFLAEVSTNRKTGPIPVATTSRDSCPPSCPLIGAGGCYAEFGPLRIHWNDISNHKKGLTFSEFLQKIRQLPRRQLWRYGQAGDLPGIGEVINRDELLELARANRGRPVIAFTHKSMTDENLSAVREAGEMGFHINLSADDVKEADDLASTGLPVATVLPVEYGRKNSRGSWVETLAEYRNRIKNLGLTTPEGRKIAICPATYLNTRCSDCRVCSHSRKGVIIGFPAHGIKRNKIGKMDTS